MTGPTATPNSPDEGAAAEVGRSAERLRSFASDHGGSGTAVISYLGRPGARIVVVAADGVFTDLVVGDMEMAASICRAAELPVTKWDRELTSLISVSPADRIRMAGTGR